MKKYLSILISFFLLAFSASAADFAADFVPENKEFKVAFNKDKSASIEQRGFVSRLHLIERGKKIWIASFDESEKALKRGQNNFGTVNQPKFSMTGRYLTYTHVGWEMSETFVYDTVKKKNIYVSFSDMSGFSKNDSYYFDCASNDFLGQTFVKVHKLDSARKDLDLTKNAKNIGSVECKYDKARNRLDYTLNTVKDGKIIKKQNFSYKFN